MRQLKITDRITRRDGLTEKYLQEISKGTYDTISPDQEYEYFVVLHNPLYTTKTFSSKGKEIYTPNDVDNPAGQAFEKLFNANVRFVVSVAKQYESGGFSLMDFVNVGNIGLRKAIQRFHHKRGFKLISYAVWWIRQEILAFIENNKSTIREPSRIRNEELVSVLNGYQDDYGRQPDAEERVLLEKQVTKKVQVQSTDALLSFDGSSKSLIDTLSSDLQTERDFDAVFQNNDIRILLEQLLKQIFFDAQHKEESPMRSGQDIRNKKKIIDTMRTNKERVGYILASHYLDHISIPELANELGLHENSIKEILGKGVKKIRYWINANPKYKDELLLYF